MNKTNLKPVVFLDRDGVINHDPGDYTGKLSEFKILPGVIEALKKWSDMGYAIVVITNQGGIARKKYTLNDFLEIDEFMTSTFRNAGINFIETYFCPHHDLVSNCLCRKPHPGMIEKALHRHHIDPKRSIMIGDKPRDIEAANAAGVEGILIESNQRLDGLELKI